MTRPSFFYWAALLCVAGLMVSCSTPSSYRADAPPLFREEKAADVILHFYQWDAIYLIKPDSRQEGFLPLLKREDIAGEMKRRAFVRDLAVVLVGYTHNTNPQGPVVREWKSLLAEQGFRRVVFLRAGVGKGNGIDGLPILHDSVIAQAHEPQGKAAATLAAVPAAAGAHVAHPSGRPIR
ncbi:MAG: hypothetical protein IH623_04535 [Verrucomicrobia bacterium]|nr:hypothetical protein [Verrucomicrobiota bacterium]